MADPLKQPQFTLENYLNYANNSLEPDIGKPDSGHFDPFARTSLINDQETTSLADEGNVLDFFGQVVWGGLSGLTWGVSQSSSITGLTGQKTKAFSDMNSMEKAGWITGEGLSLFTPFVGPFAIMGRGGSFVARKTGNKFIREAAEKIIENKAKAGGFPQLTKVTKNLSEELYSGLTNKKMASSVRQLQADQTLARTASPYLRTQTKSIIDKVLKDEGVEIAAGASREISNEIVSKLASGTYVNDIGEVVTRMLAGRDPGNISKYVGMVAQDFLYMGLHALASEKISSVIEDRDPHFKDHLKSTGVMALGFPLIRGIKGGGMESVTKGIQAYFTRFKKIKYGDMIKSDVPLAKALLDSNLNGGHFNIFNTPLMKGKTFSTKSGMSYSGTTIKELLKKDGGKWFDERPDDIVDLLNAMRTETSKHFTKLWRQGYFSDFYKSIPRLGSGILFMNYAHFNEYAFGRMGEEELASHLFMAALMTKSRGAWGHHNKQGYMSDRYGDIERSLRFLKVEKGNFENALVQLKEEELVSELGLQIYANPAADKIVHAVDEVINAPNKESFNRTGITADKIRYGKVRTLLGAYNTIKHIQDRSHKPLHIDDLTPEALTSIERNMGEILLDGKKIKDTSEADITIKLNREFTASVKQDYIDLYLNPLMEQMGFPIATYKGKIKVAPLDMDAPSDKSYNNTAKFIEFINKNASSLKIDVEQVDPISLSTIVNEWAAKNNITSNRLEKFDAAVGEIGNALERSISSKHRNHNIHMDVADNAFLRSIKVVQGIDAKDKLFKLIMGLKTDDVEISSLHKKIMNVFGRDGKLLTDISKYEIEGVDRENVAESVTSELREIQPIFNMMRTLNYGGTETSGAPIPKAEISSIAKQVGELRSRLPEAWRDESSSSAGLEAIATEVFQRRVLAGGNKMALTALKQLQDFGLIDNLVGDGGVMKVVFPDQAQVESHYGRDTATAKEVNDAIRSISGVFNPNIIQKANYVKIGDKKGEINPLKFIEVANNLKNTSVSHFLSESVDIINNLQFVSQYDKQLLEISDALNRVEESFAGKELPANWLELQEANVKMRNILKSLISEDLIGEGSAKKLDEKITASENLFNKMPVQGDKTWQYSIRDSFHDISSSINRFIKSELEYKWKIKDDVKTVTMKLSNAYAKTDVNLTPGATRALIERLTTELRDLVQQEAYSPKTLPEIILELNQANKWGDVKKVIDPLLKTLESVNVSNNSTYDNASVDNLKLIHGEKTQKKSSLTAGQIILKHSKLHDGQDPNKLNWRFKLAMDDAFVGKYKYEDVFREFVYTPLITEGQKSGKSQKDIQQEINDFRQYEAARLIQDMYGGTQRLTMEFSQGKLLQREKPLRENLSLNSLDRPNTFDNLGGYKFIILEGKGDFNGRRESIDGNRTVQGQVGWIQRILDKAIPFNADEYDAFFERAQYRDYQWDTSQMPRLESDAFASDSKTVYVRLSPKLRVLFPSTTQNLERLKTDFDTIYNVKLKQFEDAQTPEGSQRAAMLKKGFQHLLSTHNQDPSDPTNTRTKLMFVQMNRVMEPEFNAMLSSPSARQNFEYNMYKRLFIADGGTSTKITEEATRYISEYHPDTNASDMALEIMRRPNKEIYIDVVNDENDVSGFFDNLNNVRKKNEASRGLATNSNKIEMDLKELFHGSLNRDDFPSLDSFFLDGNKFASKKMGRFLWALSGRVGDFNGAKTNIMDARMLGKGFIIYHPEIAKNMKGDILVGSTVAKTLGGNARNGQPIQMFEPTVVADGFNLRTGWETQLGGITKANQLAVPLKSIGIGFAADKKTGVNLSNSMIDMQNPDHVENAIQMFQLRNVIGRLKQIESSKEHSNGELIKFLQRIKNEEYAHTSPTNNLMELLAEVGITEANPLIRKQLDQLLQSEYFEAITERPFTHGEETIIMADIGNKLSLPTYLDFINPAVTSGMGDVITGASKTRTVMQYGGGSITNSMSRVLLGTNGIRDVPFIARDPETGVDFIFTVNKVGEKGEIKTKDITIHSSMEDLVKMEWTIDGFDVSRWKNNAGDMVFDANFKGNVVNVIKDISSVLNKITNPNHGDLWHLIHQDSPRKGDIAGARRNDGVGDIIGLRNKQADLHRDWTKEYKMTTGMSVNSIPKVLKDQPLVRVEQILDKEMNGLSTINNYDIRVTLQRDFDGDHLYKYLKMPSEMLIDYTDDMGDIKDYRMFAKKEMRHHRDKLEFNMFGFDKSGVAGIEGNNIGFDKMANHVSGMKRTLSTVIGVKGTISHLANSGLQYNGKSLIDQKLLEKGANLPDNVSDIYTRTGEIFQNSLDIYKGQHKISEDLDILQNYFVYGELPDGISGTGRKADPVIAAHHGEKGRNSFFTDQSFGKAGSHPNIQKSIFQILHYTLKGTKDMYNDVWDESGSRRPQPRELRNTHSNITQLFANPDVYLFRSVMRQIAYMQKSNDAAVRAKAEVMRKESLSFFFQGIDKFYKGGHVRKLLSEGKWAEASELIGKYDSEGNPIPIFSMDSKGLGIKGSVGGFALNESIRQPVFYEKNFNLSTDDNKTIHDSLSNIETTVESLIAFGNLTSKEIHDMSNADFDATFPANDFKSGTMREANAKGIMRAVANNQFRRELSVLRYLENEAFPDLNKIERSKNKIFSIKKVVDVLDRDIIRNAFLDKTKVLSYFKAPNDPKKGRHKRQFFSKSGTLWRIKGDVQVDRFDSQEADLSKLKYFGYVDAGIKGRTVTLERGWSYILDTKEVKHVEMKDEAPAWERAFAKATAVGELDAYTILMRAGINPDRNPLVYDKLMTDVKQLRADIQSTFIDTMSEVVKTKFNYIDNFQLNDIQTNRAIDVFFSNWIRPGKLGKADIPELVRFLIQPTMQQNVFYRDGSREVPFYKMNPRLVQSIFKWLRNPGIEAKGKMKSVESNESFYGFRSSDIIRDIISDQNAYRSGNYDQVSRSINKIRNMQVSQYKVDWKHFGRTTTDEISRDWFYHPVLSKTLIEMYADPGGIFSKEDRLYVGYGKQNKPALEKTEYGCKQP